MTDVYTGYTRTEKGRRLDIEPIVGVAVVYSTNYSGWVRPVPIRLSPTVREAFDPVGTELNDDDEVVTAFPVSGVWRVQWEPVDSDGLHFLGYEVEGATNYNWDWVIENEVIETSEENDD